MPSDSESESEIQRTIYLPLNALEKCFSKKCSKTAKDVKLRICGACGEATYCSSECQKIDWPNHKIHCGPTDRIDIERFYPFIACTVKACHVHPKIKHPALQHKIINSPNPNGGNIVKFPNGEEAKLVLLGEKVTDGAIVRGLEKWWPSGLNAEVRHKLLRRISYEGLLLPIMFATCIAIIAEMYSTTAIPADVPRPHEIQPTGRRRVRLSASSSPIADIGIVHGSVRVTPQDRLAYYNFETDSFMMGQDPEDHYWLYFKTLAGAEYVLDCGMMTFNCCLMVQGDPYCRYGMPPLGTVPAFWYGKEHMKTMPILVGWTPYKKYSMLRDPRLAKLLSSWSPEFCTHHDLPIIEEMMREIAGGKRQISEWEKEMVMEFLPNACKIARLNMKNREYQNFPKEPLMMIEKDPGEVIYEDGVDGEQFEKYVKKWARRFKKGTITGEEWARAFKAWRDNPGMARDKMYGREYKQVM